MARNYVPPEAQQHATYAPHTSESAFNTAMQLHGGGVIYLMQPPHRWPENNASIKAAGVILTKECYIVQ